MSLGIFRPLCLRGDWRNPLSAKMTCHLASTSIAKGSTLCEIGSVTWIYPGQHHSSQREKLHLQGENHLGVFSALERYYRRGMRCQSLHLLVRKSKQRLVKIDGGKFGGTLGWRRSTGEL